MHEWLSGGVSPCQGEGRGFESRLVLRTRALSVMTKPFLHYRKLISCNVKKRSARMRTAAYKADVAS